jgi:hypothetical protein
MENKQINNLNNKRDYEKVRITRQSGEDKNVTDEIEHEKQEAREREEQAREREEAQLRKLNDITR